MATELDNAIASATEEILKDVPDDKKPTITTDDTNDDTQDEIQSDDEPQGDELSEAQIKEAQILYKLMLDPKQRIGIIASLAQAEGLIGPKADKPIENRKDEVKAKKVIIDIFKEALPEFPALAEKLGPAIDQVLSQEREEHQEQMAQVQLQQLENNVTKEIEILRRETKGESTKVEARMAELSEAYLMGPNTSLKDYVRSLYTLATAGRTVQKTSAQLADKIRRNANNAPDRLRTAPGSERTTEVPAGKMNLKQSVEWAIEQASKGRTKA
jgi:hypothetical protein